VHNQITGGTQHGPVLQGKDFSSITFYMGTAALVTDDIDSASQGG
jgi:hypothetical protein